MPKNTTVVAEVLKNTYNQAKGKPKSFVNERMYEAFVASLAQKAHKS